MTLCLVAPSVAWSINRVVGFDRFTANIPTNKTDHVLGLHYFVNKQNVFSVSRNDVKHLANYYIFDETITLNGKVNAGETSGEESWTTFMGSIF